MKAAHLTQRRGDAEDAEDPRTLGEWQDAVDCSHAALSLESARFYGLVTGGPEINSERCESIIRRGKVRGITPRPDAIVRFIAAYCEGKELE